MDTRRDNSPLACTADLDSWPTHRSADAASQELIQHPSGTGTDPVVSLRVTPYVVYVHVCAPLSGDVDVVAETSRPGTQPMTNSPLQAGQRQPKLFSSSICPTKSMDCRVSFNGRWKAGLDQMCRMGLVR